MKWFLSVFLVAIASNALAFNGESCRKKIPSGGIYGGILSTTSYVSSTGPCAAIGMREERREFVAANRDALEKDASRGSGEYLNVLAGLYRIYSPERQEFGRYIQENFNGIFGTKPGKAIEDVFDDLETKIFTFERVKAPASG